MSINFIPNDPLGLVSVPMRVKEPLPERGRGQAGFNYISGPPAQKYDPGSPGFLFWQSREAALTAVKLWEELAGPLTQWGLKTPNRDKLNLLPDQGDDLNAYYDRRGLNFFHHTNGKQTVFSGGSTDVVTHESGHALLDTLRPEIFGTNITEQGAFHEAFGDCTALFAALFDTETRRALLKVAPDLGAPNFAESLMEELASATKAVFGPKHAASEPRHAWNNFVFQLPTTLPTSGPPDQLTSEIHSFGRVFLGCIYDAIRNIFLKAPTRDEATLLSAAQTVGKLLIAGARQAGVLPRFFQSVGRTMVLEDEKTNNGKNREEIASAFSRHGILLGASSALMPSASLAGPAPRFRAKAGLLSLSPVTLKDIKKRIEAPQASKFSFQALRLGAQKVIEATHHREIRLDRFSKELRGVVAYAPEAVLVGGVQNYAAVFNALPDPSTTEDEVKTFVKTLLANNDIAFESKKTPARALPSTTAGNLKDSPYRTHIIASIRGKRVLTRVRYD